MKRILIIAALLSPMALFANPKDEVAAAITRINGGDFIKLAKLLDNKNVKVTAEHKAMSEKQVLEMRSKVGNVAKRDVSRVCLGVLSGVLGTACLYGAGRHVSEAIGLRLRRPKQSESKAWMAGFLGLTSLPLFFTAVTNICSGLKGKGRTDDYKNACAIRDLLKNRDQKLVPVSAIPLVGLVKEKTK